MRKKLRVIISILMLCVMCSVTVSARAGGGGGGGSSSGGGGSSHSSTGHSGSSGSRAENIAVFLMQWILFGASAGGGTFLLLQRAKRARRESRQAMAVFAQMGDNWDAKEIQKQVEEAYFQIQECWRRMDITYGAPYLSEELQTEFDSKIQWMKVKNEEVIQRNVRLLSAMPVCVQDEPGEEQDVLWYLIHGKMTGYYIDSTSRQVVRGNTKPEAFLSTGSLFTGTNAGFLGKSGSRMKWILMLLKIPRAISEN